MKKITRIEAAKRFGKMPFHQISARVIGYNAAVEDWEREQSENPDYVNTIALQQIDALQTEVRLMRENLNERVKELEKSAVKYGDHITTNHMGKVINKTLR